MLTLADICAQLSDDPGRDFDSHLLVAYSIARFLPARTIVEIGVDDGSSTLPLLLAAAQVGGMLHSVDPALCPIAHAKVAASGYSHHWQFHAMPSASFAPHCPTPVDLVLIDGDHRYEGVSSDWRHFAPKVRVGGVVLFHDKCNTTDFPGIERLINHEVALDPLWEQMTLPYGYGLTLCRRLA